MRYPRKVDRRWCCVKRAFRGCAQSLMVAWLALVLPKGSPSFFKQTWAAKVTNSISRTECAKPLIAELRSCVGENVNIRR